MDSDSSTNKPGLIINNITLTRYHEPVDTMTVAGKDSLAVERRVGTDSMVTEKKQIRFNRWISGKCSRPYEST